MNHIELWEKCLQVIKDNLDEIQFDTWFKSILPVDYKNGKFTLRLPSHFYYEFIEERFSELISKTLERITGERTDLLYQVVEVAEDENKNASITTVPSLKDVKKPFVQKRETSLLAESIYAPQRQDLDPQLNPIYNFNTFVEGKSNKLACAAGRTIADNPGKTAFNPMFVHGVSGVGKTHLVQAIGLMVKQQFPEKRVLYVPANTFVTQYTDSVRLNQQSEFLAYYQGVDVLIVDDIQEFAGKDKTQLTFFHIFNHLHQTHKQVILTSDQAPKLLQGMNERLLTRFKWGLTVELTKPDFELRRDILKSKIYRDGLEIPEDVVNYIAENVVDNVRELEGILCSLLAHTTFSGEEINMDLAVKLVGKQVNVAPTEITPDNIRDAVCEFFSLSKEKLASKSRLREIANARHIAMYLAKNLTKNSLSEIGRTIANRDHATVLHSYSVVCDLMETDKNFRQNVEAIEQIIKKK